MEAVQVAQDVPGVKLQDSHGPVAPPHRHDLRVEVKAGDSPHSLDPDVPHHPLSGAAQSGDRPVGQSAQDRVAGSSQRCQTPRQPHHRDQAQKSISNLFLVNT